MNKYVAYLITGLFCLLLSAISSSFDAPYLWGAGEWSVHTLAIVPGLLIAAAAYHRTGETWLTSFFCGVLTGFVILSLTCVVTYWFFSGETWPDFVQGLRFFMYDPRTALGHIVCVVPAAVFGIAFGKHLIAPPPPKPEEVLKS